MIRVWRLCRRRFAKTPLGGEGARLHGGRWNVPGTAVVYTASTLALATLELLVHVDRADAPEDMVALAIDIPSGIAIATIDASALPKRWREFPALTELQDRGTAWALARKTLVLRVPSAVVPQEHNYIINPAHPQIARVRVAKPEPVRLDDRLFGKR